MPGLYPAPTAFPPPSTWEDTTLGEFKQKALGTFDIAVFKGLTLKKLAALKDSGIASARARAESIKVEIAKPPFMEKVAKQLQSDIEAAAGEEAECGAEVLNKVMKVLQEGKYKFGRLAKRSVEKQYNKKEVSHASQNPFKTTLPKLVQKFAREASQDAVRSLHDSLNQTFDQLKARINDLNNEDLSDLAQQLFELYSHPGLLKVLGNESAPGFQNEIITLASKFHYCDPSRDAEHSSGSPYDIDARIQALKVKCSERNADVNSIQKQLGFWERVKRSLTRQLVQNKINEIEQSEWFRSATAKQRVLDDYDQEWKALDVEIARKDSSKRSLEAKCRKIEGKPGSKTKTDAEALSSLRQQIERLGGQLFTLKGRRNDLVENPPKTKTDVERNAVKAYEILKKAYENLLNQVRGDGFLEAFRQAEKLVPAYSTNTAQVVDGPARLASVHGSLFSPAPAPAASRPMPSPSAPPPSTEYRGRRPQ